MSTLQFLSSEKVEAADAATETKVIKWSELSIETVYAYHSGQDS